MLQGGAYYLHRGDDSDPEDFKMTHRLHLAQGILKSAGIEPKVEHDQTAHEYTGQCSDKCQTIWDSWVTDEMFTLAFSLANEIQTKRGEYHRHAAS